MLFRRRQLLFWSPLGIPLIRKGQKRLQDGPQNRIFRFFRIVFARFSDFFGPIFHIFSKSPPNPKNFGGIEKEPRK